MAKLTKPKFLVYLDDDSEAVEVQVDFTDQLRGELEAHKNGIKGHLGLHLTTVWVWCAMTRKHDLKVPFQEFMATLGGIEDADKVAGRQPEALDPTPPATTP